MEKSLERERNFEEVCFELGCKEDHDRIYGIERTSESEDLVETECDERNEKLL